MEEFGTLSEKNHGMFSVEFSGSFFQSLEHKNVERNVDSGGLDHKFHKGTRMLLRTRLRIISVRVWSIMWFHFSHLGS